MTYNRPIEGLLLLTALLLSVACNNPPTYQEDTLKENVLSEAEPLHSEIVALPDTLFEAAKRFYVYHDSMLIALNDKRENAFFIDVYDMATFEKTASFYRYGNGNGEMLSASVMMNGHTAFINDFKKAQYAFIPLGRLKAGQLGEKDIAVKRHHIHGAPTVAPYKNGVMTENPYCFYDKSTHVKQGVEQGVPRFICPSDDTELTEDNSYDYNPRNVAVDGRILCKSDGSGFAYARFGQSAIEFYDADLNLKKIVYGPRLLPIKYSEFSMDGVKQKQVIYDHKIPYSYLASTCDDDYVYCTYVGEFFEKETDIEHMKSYILKYDWEGRLVGCYSTDHYITALSKGMDKHTFYASTYNGEGVTILVKLNVK